MDEHTYAISEEGHWEQVHAYLFIGQAERALINTATRQMLVEQPFTLEQPARFSVDTYTPYTADQH